VWEERVLLSIATKEDANKVDADLTKAREYAEDVEAVAPKDKATAHTTMKEFNTVISIFVNIP
jgi:hypothetical protein